jgi:Subunit ChlI of Mg-chelatase
MGWSSRKIEGSEQGIGEPRASGREATRDAAPVRPCVLRPPHCPARICLHGLRSGQCVKTDTARDSSLGRFESRSPDEPLTPRVLGRPPSPPNPRLRHLRHSIRSLRPFTPVQHAVVASATLTGAVGSQVSVEVHVSNGLPGFTIVGLPDAAVRESRDRVRAALLSSGLPWPLRRTVVNLAPAGFHSGNHWLTSLKKRCALQTAVGMVTQCQ